MASADVLGRISERLAANSEGKVFCRLAGQVGTAKLALRSLSVRLPDFAQFFAAREDVCFCFVEAGVDVRALNGVAGRAASHEIAGILLSLAGARNHEIDAHDQRVFKTRAPIQTTIPTNITITFENLAAFSNRYRGINERKRNEVNRHGDPP